MATATERLPERWRDAVMKSGRAFAEVVPVPDADAAREHLLMNLRLAEGLDLAAYEKRWGARPDAEKIAALEAEGFLATQGDVLTATPHGRLLLNAVIAKLLN